MLAGAEARHVQQDVLFKKAERHSEDQVKHLAEQMEVMMEVMNVDPNFQEQAKLAAKQKFIEEELNAGAGWGRGQIKVGVGVNVK